MSFRGPWTHQDAYDNVVNAKARQYRVPPALVKSVIGRESAFISRPGAAGERGLMQIMPATARGLGFDGHLDLLYGADLNIDLGTKLLAENFRQARGKWDAAIAAYNAGWSRDRPYDAPRRGGANTAFVNQDYVNDVVDGWRYFNAEAAGPAAVEVGTFTKPGTKPGVTATGGMGIGVVLAAAAAAFLLLRR